VNDKSWEMLTDDTNLQDVYKLGLLSARSTNVLCRAQYTTIGAIKNLTEEDIMKCRNAGRQTLAEVMAFIKTYNNGHNDDPTEKFISVDKLIEYCCKCAETSQKIADTILDKVGHGESDVSAFGGCAYFLQRARMFRHEIPDVIKAFLEDQDTGGGRKDYPL